MRARKGISGLALLVASIGCGSAYEQIDDYDCPPEGTALSYENFGAMFMTRYCDSCHAATASDRQGAPGEYIFDSALQVRQHKARIFARSAATNDSMPPGPDDPPLAERENLAEWLACGAP